MESHCMRKHAVRVYKLACCSVGGPVAQGNFVAACPSSLPGCAAESYGSDDQRQAELRASV